MFWKWIGSAFKGIWDDAKRQFRWHFFRVLAFFVGVMIPLVWLFAIIIEKKPSQIGLAAGAIPAAIFVIAYYVTRFRKNKKTLLADEKKLAKTDFEKASMLKIISLELFEHLVRVIGLVAFWIIFHLLNTALDNWMSFVTMFFICNLTGVFFTIIDEFAEIGRLRMDAMSMNQ